jgi:hypothetical protein
MYDLKLPDLGRSIAIYNQAQSNAMRQNELKMRRDEMRARKATEAKIAALQKAAAGGNQNALRELSAVSPEAAKNIQGMAQTAEAHKLQVAEAVRKREQEKLILLARVAPTVQRNPNAYPTARAYLINSGLWSEQELEPKYSPQAIQQTVEVLPQMLGIVEDPQFSPKFVTAAEELQLPPTEWEANRGKIGERMTQIREAGQRATASSGTTVNVGGQQKLEKGNIRELQTKNMFLTDAMTQIDQLMRVGRDKFGAKGWLGGKVFGALDWANVAPESAQEWIDQKQWLTTNGSLLALKYLNATSGKQLTDRERAYVLNAVGDPDNMTYAQYQGAMKAMRQMVNYELRTTNQRLGKGIDISQVPQQQSTGSKVEQLASVRKQLESGSIEVDEAERQMAEIMGGQ